MRGKRELDSEFLTDSLSVNKSQTVGSGENFTSTSLFSCTETFKKQFPYYLSIGMTEEQYWDKDCTLVGDYRQAEELRSQKANELAWLQGMYVYDAIARISPILQAFAKKGTEARPYVEHPYPITKQSAAHEKDRQQKVTTNKGLQYMEAYMISNNKRFEERK